MNIKKFLVGTAAGAIILGATIVPAFAAYSLFDDASIVAGGNPGNAAQLVSDTTPGWGGVDIDSANGTAFTSLTTLSADYNVTDDNCGGGSPRFSIHVDEDGDTIDEVSDGNIFVYFGITPNFNTCTQNTWVSTGNLITDSDLRWDTSQIGGTFYDSYSNAAALIGTNKIFRISLVVDSGWNSVASGGDSEQTVLVDNVTVNTDVETFDPFPVSGAITNPANDGDHVTGIVNFTATYDDGDAVDDDAVQWAIRQGTCAAATGTVFGNVDGHTDSSSWNGASFSSTLDTSSLVPGEYCFVFNPTDDPGQTDVREIRTFIVDAPPVNPFTVPTQCDQTIVYNLIEGTNGSDVINGTNGNDLILAKGGSDKVDGKGGNDCIVGGNGSDKLIGGNGKDVILGGNDSDSIEGNDGTDTLYGENGSDSLKGGNGSDKLYGGANSDSLQGDNGDDILDGEAGSDSAKGGSGNDTCTAESVKQCEI